MARERGRSLGEKQDRADRSIAAKKAKSLRRSDQLAAMGAAAAVLAHEMNNQLHIIYGAAQLLEQHIAERQNGGDDTLRTIVPQIRRGLEQLRFLLKDFASLGQPQKFILEPADIVTLVREVVKSIEPGYGLHGIDLQLNIAGDLPAVAIDSQKLSQALLNLFKNGLEAMPGGGTLIVRIYKSREIVCVEVQDSGMGIPEGMDIFEPFRTTKPEGTGLGMAIVRQVVAAHGGTLTCTSREGEGTTFRLGLPITSPKRAARESFVLGLPRMNCVQ